MPNEFIINNGYISKGNSSVTGNLSVSGTITSTSNINLSGFTNGSVLFASGSTGAITGSTGFTWDNPTNTLNISGTARTMNILPTATGAYDIGSSLLRFKSGWFTSGVVAINVYTNNINFGVTNFGVFNSL